MSKELKHMIREIRYQSILDDFFSDVRCVRCKALVSADDAFCMRCGTLNEGFDEVFFVTAGSGSGKDLHTCIKELCETGHPATYFESPEMHQNDPKNELLPYCGNCGADLRTSGSRVPKEG